MPYLPEEAAVLDGLIGSYFASPNLSQEIRERYQTVHKHLISSTLTQTDYKHIQSAIEFLLPTLVSEPSEYRIAVGALATTISQLAS